MRKEIKTLHMRLGATMIDVTHDQVEAMTMADKIVVLRDGVVEQIGPPLEVYSRPANTFVAGFIGSPPINIIGCHVEGGQAVRREGGGPSLSFPLGPLAAACRGRANVRIGIPPEEVVLSAPDAALNRGTVTFTKLSGQESTVLVDLHGVPLTATVRGTSSLAIGDEVGIRFPEEALHFFDEDGRIDYARSRERTPRSSLKAELPRGTGPHMPQPARDGMVPVTNSWARTAKRRSSGSVPCEGPAGGLPAGA